MRYIKELAVINVLVVIASTTIGAAYDLNHDHGNLIGLHMGFYIGIAVAALLSALAIMLQPWKW